MEIFDKSFVRKPRNYIIQSLLALIAVGIILYFVEILTHAAIIAALGASTFIVFAMPNSVTAQPRRLIGGACCWLNLWHHLLLCFPYRSSGEISPKLGVYILVCLCFGGRAIHFCNDHYQYRAPTGVSYCPQCGYLRVVV